MAQVFSSELCQIFKNTFFIEHLWWLLVLPELSETVSIQQLHVGSLVTEVYKSTSYLNSNFIWSFFTQKEIPYNIRKAQVIHTSCKINMSQNYLSAPQRILLVWNNSPNYIKSSKAVCELKNNINNFKDVNSGCLICRLWICRCNPTYLFLLLLLLLFSFSFVIMFSDWVY